MVCWIQSTTPMKNSTELGCSARSAMAARVNSGAIFISALRMTGYDHALSIEHEDSLMTAREGLEKAIRFLQSIVLNEPKGDVTWA